MGSEAAAPSRALSHLRFLEATARKATAAELRAAALALELEVPELRAGIETETLTDHSVNLQMAVTALERPQGRWVGHLQAAHVLATGLLRGNKTEPWPDYWAALLENPDRAVRTAALQAMSLDTEARVRRAKRSLIERIRDALLGL